MKRRILAVVLVLALLPLYRVQAKEEVPPDLYLTQAGSRTCTLCSATMMLRSCMYINRNDLWQSVTEASVGAYAWTSDGLYWNWSYYIDQYTMTVAQQGCGGITADELKTVLNDHPEGVVLYCGGGAPHAVFLTDCQGDTFYCADPAMGYAEKRIPLEQSLLGDRHGGQAEILSAVSAYWYISSHNIEDQSYLAGCKTYPTDCRIRVRWDGYAMSLPCGAGQAEDSERVFRIHSGEYYTASAFLLNDAGQYWYRVGEDLYISAEDARCVQPEKSVSVPAKQEAADISCQEDTEVVLLLIPEFLPKNTK